ncbi:MAG TPA: HEPN domain-containing protein [Desulfuromonadales bacterium]|nr:HEPN domain-containing protein [Desulfuromonadales bacterium]
MTATEEFILDWMKKAEHDLKAAKILLSSGEEIYDSVCFHSQQLAEKALKALFTARTIEFPKTHNLLLLSNLLLDADILKLNEDLENLTNYAVESRYPGDYVEPGLEDAQEALDAATKLYDLVKQKLGLL